MTTIPKLSSALFDWLAWRSGSIIEMFSVRHRTVSLLAAKDILKKHAVGWCPAENIPCRPKLDNVAVMFQTDGREWWTHLRNEEFKIIFGDNNE
jgi:hypothetical protein